MRNYFKFGQVVKEEMSFKGVLFFNSGGHFVQRSETVCAFFIEGIRRIISVKLF